MSEQPRPPAAQPFGLALHTSTHGSDGAGDADTPAAGGEGEPQVVIVGPDGQPIGAVPASMMTAVQGAVDASADGDGAEADGGGERSITDLVEQPAKVMRIGSMIRQLLEEVKSSPLDEASRNRLKQIHRSSIEELEQGLAPELVEELNWLTLPFSDDVTPTEGELRIAQAQLVGWLEGLFHGIQTAIYAQQMAARAQFEQMRKALPAGMVPGQPGQPGHPGQGQGGHGGQGAGGADERPHDGGMYL